MPEASAAVTTLTTIQGGPGPDGKGWRKTWTRALGAGPSAITVLNGHARGGGLRDPLGTFSIKWIARGRAVYRADGGASHALSGARTVILNAAQPYELEFPDADGTQTLCVFFSDDLLRAAWSERAGAFDGETPTALPAFPDIVFRPDARIAKALSHLRASFDSADPTGEASEDDLLLLAEAVVASAAGHAGAAARTGARKPSTRKLLLARLERAREILDDAQGGEVALDVLAKAASLSKFHLLRLFKQVHGCTPSGYARQARLARAMALLLSSRLPGAQIAQACGYDSESAFARAFRRHTGLTPGSWRSATN